jgi:hypothetical protein
MFRIFKEDEQGTLISIAGKFETGDQAVRWLSGVFYALYKNDSSTSLKVCRKLEQRKTFDYVELKYRLNCNNPTLPQKMITENYYITSFNSISLKDVI